jgi:hypothetical protein
LFSVASSSVTDETKPVTVGGSPTIDTPDSYFLATPQNQTYRLFTMTGSGSSAPALTVQDISGDDGFISAPTFDGRCPPPRCPRSPATPRPPRSARWSA